MGSNKEKRKRNIQLEGKKTYFNELDITVVFYFFATNNLVYFCNLGSQYGRKGVVTVPQLSSH